MAESNSNTQNKNGEVYEISPKIMNSALGYSATIDGDNIMVVPNRYGEGYNRQNEKISIIKEKGFVLVNGEETTGGRLTKLTDDQLYQLVIAGVIILNSQQQSEFRKTFFNLSKTETERKK